MSHAVGLLANGVPSREHLASVLQTTCQQDRKAKNVSVISAASLLVLIPFIHLGIVSLLWKKYNFPVDRQRCTCSCWDTVFKGQYETGVAAYKHVYFNVTANTLKIWTVTVAYLLGLYEAVKRLVTLAFLGRLRLSMFLLFSTAVYPHYYSWWSFFNYWNDDYYSQWYHQLCFSVTEIVSTLFVVKLLDSKNKPQARELLVILTVAAFHISASLYDQFLSNVLRGEGKLHQVLRDLGFMFPDLLHFAVPWLELRKTGTPLRRLFSSGELAWASAFIITSWIYIALF